ncbi:hypothetical protein K443DRAFT_685880, partial [Laccaria amethystina LaAM-08-1]
KCCPSAPFFEAQDVTHNRDVVVGRKSQLHRIKRRGVFPETRGLRPHVRPQDRRRVPDAGTTTPRNPLSTRCSPRP